MKLTDTEDQIYVKDSTTSTLKALKTFTESEEEAFYILDIGDVIQKHQEWVSKMPRVKPYYDRILCSVLAVKCNDNITVLRTLAALGAGFDCASTGELKKVMSLGVRPNRIIFANPTKPALHLRNARTLGVDLMTFDNEEELHKTKELYPKARLVLRIRCDAERASVSLGGKYGCDAISEAPHLLRLAHSLGLQVVGVCFHVGSGCEDAPVFTKAIGLARKLFDLGTELGFNMYFLDLGGGFPGNCSSTMDKIADVINSALKKYFPPDTETQIIAEPGRYYVETAFTFVTNIHSKKDTFSDDIQLLHTKYYISGGVYSTFLNDVFLEHRKPIVKPLMEPKNGEVYSCSVWGQYLDIFDLVMENALLPKLNIGDWLVFSNLGAYTLVMACTFNGFPIPKVYAVINEEDWRLVKNGSSFKDDQFVFHRFLKSKDVTKDGQASR